MPSPITQRDLDRKFFPKVWNPIFRGFLEVPITKKNTLAPCKCSFYCVKTRVGVDFLFGEVGRLIHCTIAHLQKEGYAHP